MKGSAPLDARQLALSFDESPAAAAPRAEPPPQGDRNVRVDGQPIHYSLRRARRRSIGFTIDDRGLTIAAPRWVTIREIEAAIVEKARWIRTRLAGWAERRAAQPLPAILFADGGVLPYLGSPLALRLRADARSATLDEAPGARYLVLPLATDAGADRIRDALLAPRSPRPPAGWRLSSARSQWGSCTHDGRIRLNWRLVHFSLPVIDYVIAHELAHLAEMNHSARFWGQVGALLPGFERARDEIKRKDIGALPI
jgi:predicted metal-dependent hydrolase